MSWLTFIAEFIAANPWRAGFIALSAAFVLTVKFQSHTISKQSTQIETLQSSVAVQKDRLTSQSTIIATQSASIEALKQKSLTLETQARKAIESNSKAKKQLALKLREVAEMKVSDECQPAIDVLKNEAKGVANAF